MMYINIDKIAPTPEWSARAAKAKAAVAAQKKEAGDCAVIWKSLKKDLAALSHNKCWYCEQPTVRQDNAVDHFRPKGAVSDAAKKHEGYTWLAFDPKNFRFACQFCNSVRNDITGTTKGGKGARFPLIDENQRRYCETDTGDEEPILLDPCAPGDCLLLGVQKENGQPCAAGSSAEEIQRANISIEVYHLNQPALCTARHTAISTFLSNVSDAKRLALKDPKNPVFKSTMKRILDAISPREAFSGDLRYVLRGERHSDHDWIEKILNSLQS